MSGSLNMTQAPALYTFQTSVHLRSELEIPNRPLLRTQTLLAKIPPTISAQEYAISRPMLHSVLLTKLGL